MGKGWIKWRSSAAREILIEDLEEGGWLYDDQPEAHVVFEIYKQKQVEYQDVPFDQFEVRYNDAIKRSAKRRERAILEEAWLLSGR